MKQLALDLATLSVGRGGRALYEFVQRLEKRIPVYGGGQHSTPHTLSDLRIMNAFEPATAATYTCILSGYYDLC